MEWNDLPTGAKNVLEWLENPLTGTRKTLTFARGKVAPHSGIMLSDALFEAMTKYVEAHRAAFSVIDISGDALTLKLS